MERNNTINTNRKQEIRIDADTLRMPLPSRRAFLFGVARVSGAVALSTLYPVAAFAGLPFANREKTGPVTVIQFGPDGKKVGKVTIPRVVKTEEEWQSQLAPVSFVVTRKSGTERAYTGATWDEHGKGIFRCICCDLALFSSETKFDSGTGWPSFWAPIARENVSDAKDESLGMLRSAVSCTLCDAHLGHVFDDGPRPTGLRYCMNSAAMVFQKLG